MALLENALGGGEAPSRPQGQGDASKTGSEDCQKEGNERRLSMSPLVKNNGPAISAGPLDPPLVPPEKGPPDPINIPSPEPDSVDDPIVPEPIGIPGDNPSDIPDPGPFEVPDSPDAVVF
jgi:hypothetical protein